MNCTSRRVGDFKRGDVLAVLDRTSFDADAADARGTLLSAEAKLAKLQIGFRKEEKRGAKNDMEAAEADLVQTKADFSRIDELFSKGPGISVTKTDWDAARANRDRASRRYLSAQAHYDMTMNGSRKEDIDEAAADVNVAKARLRKALWRLDNCTIRAQLTAPF